MPNTTRSASLLSLWESGNQRRLPWSLLPAKWSAQGPSPKRKVTRLPNSIQKWLRKSALIIYKWVILKYKTMLDHMMLASVSSLRDCSRNSQLSILSMSQRSSQAWFLRWRFQRWCSLSSPVEKSCWRVPKLERRSTKLMTKWKTCFTSTKTQITDNLQTDENSYLWLILIEQSMI